MSPDLRLIHRLQFPCLSGQASFLWPARDCCTDSLPLRLFPTFSFWSYSDFFRLWKYSFSGLIIKREGLIMCACVQISVRACAHTVSSSHWVGSVFRPFPPSFSCLTSPRLYSRRNLNPCPIFTGSWHLSGSAMNRCICLEIGTSSKIIQPVRPGCLKTARLKRFAEPQTMGG